MQGLGGHCAKEREEIVEQPRQRLQDLDVLAERRNGVQASIYPDGVKRAFS